MQAEQLASGLDLVVATPGRLVEHLEAGNLNLSACKAVVLDEVDVLLGWSTSQAVSVSMLDSLTRGLKALALHHAPSVTHSATSPICSLFEPRSSPLAPGPTQEQTFDYDSRLHHMQKYIHHLTPLLPPPLSR